MTNATSSELIAVALRDVELAEGWVEAEPHKRGRFAFCLTAAEGCAASSVIYFEVAPGDSVLRHVHSAEEVLLLVEGRAEVEVDGAIGEFAAEALVVVPAMAPHALRNTGDGPLLVVGFFPAAAMVHTYEAEIAPFGTDVIVTPAPEQLVGWRG